jgi:hypothetical protein
MSYLVEQSGAEIDTDDIFRSIQMEKPPLGSPGDNTEAGWSVMGVQFLL